MKQIDKVVQTLIINGTFNEQPGLFYGKTGIAIFFFHYARHSGKRLFQDYAFDLFEEIKKQLTISESTRYDIGLSGIGVGVEYLLQNGFIEAINDDLFNDFDARMYRAAMYEPYPNLSIEEGVAGLGRYFIHRIRGKCNINYKLHEALSHIIKEISNKIEENSVPENEQPDVCRFFYDLSTIPDYTEKIVDSFKLCREWKCIDKPDIQNIFPYMSHLQRLFVCQKYLNKDLKKEIEMEWAKWEDSNNDLLTDMGLQNGWSAEGLLYLTFFFNYDVSWIDLL